MRQPTLAVVLLACVSGPAVYAAESAELSRLFPNEVQVFVETEGLARLALTTEVLAACRSDLSDLRLFDRHGREIPFLADAGRDLAEHIEAVREFDPPILEASREEKRPDDGPPLRREAFDLGMPDDVSNVGWVLIVDPGERDFAARVQIQTLDKGGETAPLVDNGSLFRLRGERRTEKLRLSLPRFAAPRLRVVLESEERSWLEPSFRLESARVLERGTRIATALEPLSMRSDGGRTVVELARPGGIVPELLRIETATRTFDREVVVWDEGPTAAAGALGAGRIFRVEAVTPVGDQELALRPARGHQLRVEIVDEDSPVLTELEFVAVIRQPTLVFSVEYDAAAGSPAATLRFGGGRAHSPHYDLASLAPAPGGRKTGARAEAAALLYDADVVHPARMGEIRENPMYDGAPALAFAMQAGSRIDPGVFRHTRTLQIPAAPEGLSQLTLQASDLAVLNPALSDLRIADESSRQWPYLLDRKAVTQRIPLEIEGPDSSDGESSYRLRLPAAPLSPHRLLVDIDVDYFDRAFRIEARNDGGAETTLVAGRLTRPIGDPRVAGIELPGRRVESLRLVIEDGDDAPLVLRSVHATLLLPRLYLTAPEGSYRLLLGASDQSAPHYELERVRDFVLAVRSAAISAEPLTANPDSSLRSRLKDSGLRQSMLLWVLLIVTVIVLVAMTLRMTRR